MPPPSIIHHFKISRQKLSVRSWVRKHLCEDDSDSTTQSECIQLSLRQRSFGSASLQGSPFVSGILTNKVFKIACTPPMLLCIRPPLNQTNGELGPGHRASHPVKPKLDGWTNGWAVLPSICCSRIPKPVGQPSCLHDQPHHWVPTSCDQFVTSLFCLFS